VGYHLQVLCIVALLCLGQTANAEKSERFDRFELHYSVVNTTFLSPEVARTYGLVRGDRRAILTLAVREDLPEGSATRPMQLNGRTWDLIQNQDLTFQEIREGDAVYYLADFKFINEEWRFFEINFRPEGAGETFTFKFKHQLYTEQ
jgi:hypothetical protein